MGAALFWDPGRRAFAHEHAHDAADHGILGHESERPAIVAVAAIVTHHQKVTGRDGGRTEVGSPVAKLHDVRVGAEHLHESATAFSDGNGGSIDGNMALPHCDDVAPHSGHTLDEHDPGLRRFEHDHIATRGFVVAGEVHVGQGQSEAVGALFDGDAVTLVEGGQHRSAGNMVVIGERRPDREDDGGADQDGEDVVEAESATGLGAHQLGNRRPARDVPGGAQENRAQGGGGATMAVTPRGALVGPQSKPSFARSSSSSPK